MKKTYSKPEIFFENFSLSTSIAGNCDVIIGLPSQFACGIPDENGTGSTIFSSGNCTFPGDENTMYDKFCYHVPSDGSQLFNS